MSNNLKESQVMAAYLIAIGFPVRLVSKELNIREETICRWKKITSFKTCIKKYQSEFISNIETKHFSLVQKAFFNIEKALDDDGLSFKDKADLSIRYLKSTTNYLSKNINEFNFNLEKEKNKKIQTKECREDQFILDEAIKEYAELKRRFGHLK